MEEPVTVSSCDLLVVSVGQMSMSRAINLTQKLWSAGITAEIMYDWSQSQEELQEYCRHHEITYVALVSDKEGSHVKVKTRGNLSQFNNQISQTVLTMERPTFPLRFWPWPWVETHYFILLLNC